jgi:hypothetical protein
MKNIIFFVVLTAFSLSACGGIPTKPVPTDTLFSPPTGTLVPTATATLTPNPTATKELTLEEKFGGLVPADEIAVNKICSAGVLPGYLCFIIDRAAPPGTLFADMNFRATGESRIEQTSLGKVAMVHLVYRDVNGVLQDVWMMYAGYSFGLNKDGINFIGIIEGNMYSGKMGTSEELLKLVCPGTQFDVWVAWQKGPGKNECSPGLCNEFEQEAYRRITVDSEELKLLTQGHAVNSSDFRLVPWSISINHGALTASKNGLGWEFDTEGNTEGCTERWEAGNQITSLQVSQGQLTAQSTGNDSYIGSPGFYIDAKVLHKIEISMKVSSGSSGQVFFITDSDPTFDEAKSLRFSITPDDKFHTYILDMTKVIKWSGTITKLRLHPTDMPANIDIDYIHFLKGH